MMRVKIFLLVAILCFVPIDAFAAIAMVDTASTTDCTGSGYDTLTWSVDVSGIDRFMLIYFGMNQVGLTADSILSVKYNNVDATLINWASQGTITHQGTWGLVAPDVGTHDVELIMNRTSAGCIRVAAISMTGVDADTAYYNVGDTTRGWSSSITFGAWGGANIDDWVFAFASNRGAQTSFTASSPYTDYFTNTVAQAICICQKVGASGVDPVEVVGSTANNEVLSILAINASSAAGDVTVSPTPAISIATAVDPTVLGGDVTVIPDEAIVNATAIDPDVMGGVGESDRVFYMSSTGSNLTGDGSRGNPYLTLGYIARNVLNPDTGDTVMVMSGTHAGDPQIIGFNCKVRGHPDTFLTIMADPLGETVPVIDANDATNVCWAFYARYSEPSNNDPADDVAYVRIKGIHFTNSIQCCLYIVDGGCPDLGHDSRTTPAHHIIIEDCEFSYPGVPYHPLKFAGVDTFLIQDCKFHHSRGPMIDMVGAHYGTVKDCTFNECMPELWPAWNDQKGSGIVVKGGSAHITIYNCYFERAGYSAIHIGQQTGCNLFRPAIGTVDGDGDICDYEAKDISVYACVVNKSRSLINFNSSRGGHVFNNTLYNAVSRSEEDRLCIDNIIHAYTQPHYACDTSMCVCPGGVGRLTYTRGGYFLNNIAYFGTPIVYNDSLHTWYEHMTGSYYMVHPETFRLSYNLWYHHPDPTLSMPPWTYYANEITTSGCPAHDSNITGNPLFMEASPDTAVDFMLQSSSPALAAGSTYVNVIYDWWGGEYIDSYDYNGNPWSSPKDIGAFAGADGDVSVSPDAAIAIAVAVDPAVGQSNTTVVPGAAAAVATAVDPTVEATFNITPDAAVSAATAIDPTVMLASITISPEAAEAAGVAVNPTVEGGESPFVPVARYRRRRRL